MGGGAMARHYGAGSRKRLRILALEPYYGGSHRAVLDGLVEHIDAEWTLSTLPARKWKWRMRGAAITMAAEARRLAEEYRARAGKCARTATTDVAHWPERPPWDLVFASTFVNLAEFKGLAAEAVAGVPTIVYFHENQLVYPNRHEAEWDFQFPLTNITSALCADRCLFNTRWNLERFLAEIGPFLKRFPDHHPTGVADAVAEKSAVLAPPFDPTPFDAHPPVRGEVSRIVWPHRWEHDKDPKTFLSAVGCLAEEDLAFEVVIAGQAFRETTDEMRRAAESALGQRLVQVGEPASRDAYAALLASADIAVSTAENEFFGLAMIEASYAGCYPLVPDRLAYPELYEPEFRYAHTDSLVARLRSLLLDRPGPGAARAMAEEFTFERLASRYTEEFDHVAARETPE